MAGAGAGAGAGTDNNTGNNTDKKIVTNEEIMDKLVRIEQLILEMSRAQVELKTDTKKMSEHIDTVDAVMSKMPFNFLGGLSFKLLKP